MAAEHNPLTPQQRLAMSRRALVAQLQGRNPRLHAAPGFEAPEVGFDEPPSPPHESMLDRIAWLQVGRQVARRWWQRHPANAATQLARPLLERYAREQPGKLIAGAAGTGALLVLVKPWRLLSVTAVVAMLLKTSDVADLVTTLMHKTPEPPRKDIP
ncbi:hypothetical protein [Variovorax sp. KK3]|uniref:hypothetical protein n=1 Tax=Variovorax sp. KK3 TaxID=1855728 RepID=UPI00097BD557|nr:hypothetical protein [Variovorax sp. KK3]